MSDPINEDAGSPLEEKREDAGDQTDGTGDLTPKDGTGTETESAPPPPPPLDPSPYVVGIDLGTSTSSIAVYLPNRAGGFEPVLLDVEGAKLMPSVVHVSPENGEIIVGVQAKGMMLIDPENTVASIKREMGNASYAKEFEGIKDRKFSPSDIAAEILKKLVSEAEKTQGIDFKGRLVDAVISVPANFEDNKRRATEEAGRLAGLNVKEIIDEPVAAAMAYAHAMEKTDQSILVYDLGGGTFDVSILDVKSGAKEEGAPIEEKGTKPWTGKFRVRASEGIPDLGGDDFDNLIMRMTQDRFNQEHGLDLDLFDLKKEQCGGVNTKTLRLAGKMLKEAAEKAKIDLAALMSATIQIPGFMKDGAGRTYNLSCTITREEFDAAAGELIARSKEAIERALKSADMSKDEISRVVLVGGSTKMPIVEKMVTELIKAPYRAANPQTAVVEGAAIYAGLVPPPPPPPPPPPEPGKGNGPEGPKLPGTEDGPISIDTEVRHYLGIALHGGEFDTLIEKGLPLNEETPVQTVERNYACPRDDMTQITIAAYQADPEVSHVHLPGCTYIGEFVLDGIPPGPRGRERIKVTFSVNKKNRVHVTATVLSTNVTKELEARTK